MKGDPKEPLPGSLSCRGEPLAMPNSSRHGVPLDPEGGSMNPLEEVVLKHKETSISGIG